MRTTTKATRILTALVPLALLATALLSAGSSPAHAGTGVLLRYHLTIGQHFSYRTVASVPPLPGVAVSNDAAGKPVLTVRDTLPLLVKYAYPDGSYSIKFGPFGGTIAVAGPPLTFDKMYYQVERIGSRGQVRGRTAYGSTNTQSVDATPTLYLPAFPIAPVDAGSTWTGTQRVSLQPYGTFTETDRYTLTAFETVAGRRIAVLTTAGTAPVHLRLPGSLGVNGRMDGILSSSGTARVFVDTGMILDQRSVETFHLQFLGSTGDLIPIEASETVSVTLQP